MGGLQEAVQPDVPVQLLTFRGETLKTTVAVNTCEIPLVLMFCSDTCQQYPKALCQSYKQTPVLITLPVHVDEAALRNVPIQKKTVPMGVALVWRGTTLSTESVQQPTG